MLMCVIFFSITIVYYFFTYYLCRLLFKSKINTIESTVEVVKSKKVNK